MKFFFKNKILLVFRLILSFEFFKFSDNFTKFFIILFKNILIFYHVYEKLDNIRNNNFYNFNISLKIDNIFSSFKFVFLINEIF